jgi:hypothetical protein
VILKIGSYAPAEFLLLIVVFVFVAVPHHIDALDLVAQSELIAVIPERLVQAYASVLNLVMKKVDVGTFDEYLLHSARTHADIGCSWFREVTKAFVLGTERPPTRAEKSRNVRAVGKPEVVGTPGNRLSRSRALMSR